jgi:hypothetical protein
MNINDCVKIKLTPFGIDTLRKQHEQLSREIQGRNGKVLDT